MISKYDSAEAFDFVEEKPAEKKKADAFKYHKLALQFLAESGLVLRHYRGKDWLYRDDHYEEENELTLKVRQFFVRQGVPHNNTIIGNVLPFIRALTFLDGAEYPEMPFWFGEKKCQPGNVVAYTNGLLDLSGYLSGSPTLIDHSPNWISSVCLPYDFDPAAGCDRWLSFLDEVFEGDAQKVALLQEWFGYCLTHDTSQHKLMILQGVPRAGKGTIIRVLQALVGSQNSTGFNLWYLAERFGLSSLVGKLVAFVGEVDLTGSREKYRILETLNSIVGGDPCLVEEKHNPQMASITLPTRFVIACNEFPNFHDTSGALSERLLLLDFNRSFSGREDRGLGEKLIAEISGINNWALTGLARLKEQGGFTIPTSMATMVNEVRRESSLAYAFAQDRLVIHRSLDAGNLKGLRFTPEKVMVLGSDLEAAWYSWCQENHVEGKSYKWLCKDIRTILPKLNRERKRVSDQRVYYFPGIGLREDEASDPDGSDPLSLTDELGGSAAERRREEMLARNARKQGDTWAAEPVPGTNNRQWKVGLCGPHSRGTEPKIQWQGVVNGEDEVRKWVKTISP